METTQRPGLRSSSCVMVLALGALAAPVAASAAPIGTNTALPLSAGEIIVREQFVATHASDRAGGIRRTLDHLEWRTVVGYGPTSKLAAFAVLPFVDVRHEFQGQGRSERGLGDATVFARYQLYAADGLGRTTRIAPFAGLRLPTGKDGRTGDGSLDVVAGVIATWATTQWVLDAQLGVDFNGEADGFERGDAAALDTSFQYRLRPAELSQDGRAFVFAVLELGARYSRRDRLGGVIDPNSGGFEVYVTPGLQYATRRWIADVGLRVPLANDLNGTALETDYSVLASIRANF